ncbi:MAG: hypothetical protein KJ971_03265 [Firmicutes bacterium]|nr:hypothetical protein [Bacillota bacterium]
MKAELLMDLLKQEKIIDDRGLYSKIQIVYSEYAKVLKVASGMTTSAGQDGYIGVYENSLVCFEHSLIGGKPTKEVFRVPFENILEHELRKGFLGLSFVLLIKTNERKYKLVATLTRKQQIQAIEDAIKK